MRAVVQRVTCASVSVAGSTIAAVDTGLLVYVGVSRNDTSADVEYVARKVVNLRVFDDENGVMNRSLLDLGRSGGVGLIAVSQFTLFGDVRKGHRPSYNDAAPPEPARVWFHEFVAAACRAGVDVQTGEFGRHMVVTYSNDGPVTILIDSEKLF